MACSSKGPTNSGFNAYDNSTVTVKKLINKNVIQQEGTPKKKTFRQIPFSVENFVGRGDEMKKILDYFNACNDSDAHPLNRMFIITGSAGMGKSELAKKFAETHKEFYPTVVFLNSETKDSLDASFTQLAIKLKLIEADPNEPHQSKSYVDIKTKLPEIYEALSEGYDRALFIFDNAVALEPSSEIFGIRDYLPQSDYLQMPFFLVTSRNPDFWENQVKPLSIFPLSLLPDEETHKFLLKMSQLDKEEIAPGLQELLRKITSILGGYPLGLKLMSEIKTTGDAGSSRKFLQAQQRLKGYLKILENTDKKLASHKLQAEERKFKLLGAIFERKVEMISKENADAVRLLGIISFMNVDEITLFGCYGIFYRTPVQVNYSELDKCMATTWQIKGALWKLKEQNIVDTEDTLFYSNDPFFDLESKIKIHRELQHLMKMRLASFRDTSLLTEIVLWNETICNNFSGTFTHVLEDMLDIFDLSQMPPVLTLYFRFLRIFSRTKRFHENQTSKHFVKLEEKLISQTDLRNIVEMGKMLRQGQQKGEVDLIMEESNLKLEEVVENIKLYDEIWKIYFCIECCEFLTKEHQKSISTKLTRLMAEEMQVIDNDLITEHILKVLGKCWKFVEGSKISQDENARNIASILIQLEPHNWLYIVRGFWGSVRKMLKEPKILEAFLEEDWIPWICNILANLNGYERTRLALEYWYSYFTPILEIFRSILLSNCKQAKMLVESNQFLEILTHHTQVILSHEEGFYNKIKVTCWDLPVMALLIWSELEAKVQPSNSVSHLIESTLNDWINNSGRIFWLHDLKGEVINVEDSAKEDAGVFMGGEVRRKIKLSLEDPELSFSPAMERSLKWILVTSPRPKFDEYSHSNCNRFFDRDQFHWNLFKTEISHQIESLKQKELGDVALDILKIMSFFDTFSINLSLKTIFKTFIRGAEALNVLQRHFIIHTKDEDHDDRIILDPIAFEVIWEQMEADERLSLLGKVSDFFMENMNLELRLNELVLRKANLDILLDRDQITWLRLLLSHFTTNYRHKETELKEFLGMKNPVRNDPAHIYSLICVFLAKEVDNNGERVVREGEILTALDALLVDKSISLSNWNIHIVLAVLPMLEINIGNEVFQLLVSWTKELFANEFIPGILNGLILEEYSIVVKFKCRIAETCYISLAALPSEIKYPEDKSFWTCKLILALFNFHGINGLVKFWTDFKEQIEKIDPEDRPPLFVAFLWETLKLLQMYDLNDEVAIFFDFNRHMPVSEALTSSHENCNIEEFKGVLESLEDYAEQKLREVVHRNSLFAVESMGSFMLFWLRILHAYLLFPSLLSDYEKRILARDYPGEPNLDHGKQFSIKFLTFSGTFTMSATKITLQESTKEWLKIIIADVNQTEGTAVVAEAALWFLRNSAGDQPLV